MRFPEDDGTTQALYLYFSGTIFQFLCFPPVSLEFIKTFNPFNIKVLFETVKLMWIIHEVEYNYPVAIINYTLLTINLFRIFNSL